jgi:glutathione-regulated potassium-efflux system protein KefB
MAEASLGQVIGPAVVLMGAAVVAVPVFRRIGLGSVLGFVTTDDVQIFY